MEATRRGGLRARTCQTARKNKRKDAHRKPLLPNLRVADVIARLSFFKRFFCRHVVENKVCVKCGKTGFGMPVYRDPPPPPPRKISLSPLEEVEADSDT
jgi:hypothetical protein